MPTRVSRETERGRSLSSSTGTPESTTGASWRARPSPRHVTVVDGQWLHLLTRDEARERVPGRRARRRGTCGTRPAGAGLRLATHSTTTPLRCSRARPSHQPAALDGGVALDDDEDRGSAGAAGWRRALTGPTGPRLGLPPGGHGSTLSRARGDEELLEVVSEGGTAGALLARWPASTGLCGDAVCGSHFNQSQSAAEARAAKALTTSSAGECSATAWITRARAASRAAARPADPEGAGRQRGGDDRDVARPRGP